LDIHAAIAPTVEITVSLVKRMGDILSFEDQGGKRIVVRIYKGCLAMKSLKALRIAVYDK
jgi:hypothetical protein